MCLDLGLSSLSLSLGLCLELGVTYLSLSLSLNLSLGSGLGVLFLCLCLGLYLGRLSVDLLCLSLDGKYVKILGPLAADADGRWRNKLLCHVGLVIPIARRIFCKLC